MKEIKKNSFIDESLEYLKEKSMDFLDLSFDIIFDPQKIIHKIPYSGYSSYPISKKIYSLKNSSYFSTKNNKIYLTAKGRIEIIRRIIKNKKGNEKWEGRWWAIIFDIPELKRRERSFLRRELKLIGLREIQKSVWIFPFDIEKELLALLKLWKKNFGGDIRFLKIDKITEDNDIKKMFKL